MKFTHSIIAIAFAVPAASALAATSVETYGRNPATAGNGATATFTAGCTQGCHVSDVQGRSALNVAGSKRSAPSGNVTVRNADVEAVFGRA
jgi:hypothetical protein